MVDEQLKEEVTSYDGTGPHGYEGEPQDGYHRQRQRHPQSSDVGEALEQVIRLAEDLQEDFLPENKRNRVRCDTPPPPSALMASAASREVGLLSRLFKSNRLTHPRSRSEVHWSTGSSGSEKENASWSEYERDFQNV
jgi:hypothetical protein